jgi:hypothetical protein
MSALHAAVAVVRYVLPTVHCESRCYRGPTLGAGRTHIQNLTSDNASSNDKAMECLATKMKDEGLIFDAKEQRSQ